MAPRDGRSILVAGAAVCLGLTLLGFHLAYKRRPDSRNVARVAAGFRQTSDWVGRPAPDFEVELLDGTTFRLADEVGRRVVILNFFATWCAPCRAEMPELERFVRGSAGQPVTLVAIDAEEKRDAVKAFLAGSGVDLRVAIDSSGELLRRYGVDSFPTTVLIGPDGRVRLYQVGPILNADVAFEGLMRASIEDLAGGKGISREAYLASASTGESVLPDRAADLVRKMACPCGCDHMVSECRCATARGIRARLAGALGEREARSDEEIVRDLNREYCAQAP